MAQQLLAKPGEENFVCLVEDNARRWSTKPALVWDGGSLSWAELDQKASGFARFLARQGAGPGDRVAMLIPTAGVLRLLCLESSSSALPQRRCILRSSRKSLRR